MTGSTSKECRSCITNLRLASTGTGQQEAQNHNISEGALARDLAERLSLWAGNIGAFHPPGSSLSLEARLHDARDVLAYILQLLVELNETVVELSCLMSGERQEAESAAEDDSSEDSQVQELFEEIEDSIKRLFKASDLIRRVAPTDVFSKALSRTRYHFNDQFDIAHVGEKYPKLAAASSTWLRERLGRAITQRRHYLAYIQDHRRRLEGSSIIEEKEGAPKPMKADSKPRTDHHVSMDPQVESASRPSTFFTKATTLRPGVLNPHMLIAEDPEEDSRSYTTVARSTDSDTESPVSFKIPDLARLRTGARSEFECCFCFHIVKIEHERQWRRHVFSDLRTYVCTFPDCETAYFKDINDWFLHEMQTHRVNYTCRICHNRTFKSKAQYLIHVQKEHPMVTSNTDERSLLNLARQPMLQIPAQDCPCCSGWETRLQDRAISPDTSHNSICVEPRIFKRHLASHLEHLALFAAPVLSVHVSDGDSNAAAQQRSGLRSAHDETCEDGHWFASLDIKHSSFDLVNQAPFTIIGSLGRGPWTVVEKVISTIDSRVYALKRIHALNKRGESSFQSAQAEIDILKKIGHDHVVSYLGSFSDRSWKGHDIYCALFPEAETNLMDYLVGTPTSRFRELRTFFGCLATGLSYLHAQKIRHGDIKPSNILVDHGNVLISGFGMALDFSSQKNNDRGTTTGACDFTRRYAAPEVSRRKFVNVQSDIWALGETFVDMIAVLKGRTFQEYHSSGYEYGHNILDQYLRALPGYLEQLRERPLAADNAPLEWIRLMLSEDPEMRPEASSLASLITSVEDGRLNPFCRVCCLSSTEMESG